MFKTANVGPADRVLRIVVGLVLILAPYFYASPMWDSAAMRWGLPIVGAILVFTAIVRFCPLYRLVGMSTCRTS